MKKIKKHENQEKHRESESEKGRPRKLQPRTKTDPKHERDLRKRPMKYFLEEEE